MRIDALSGWSSDQKHVVTASFLGWTLDAFDFFLLVFVLKDIAAEFGTQITDVTFAILLTLAVRPIGAYIFGHCHRQTGASRRARRLHCRRGAGCAIRAKMWEPLYARYRRLPKT